jgi:hypothetical protein
MRESRDPNPIVRDRKSDASFEPLAEIITDELLAGGALGDPLATADGARGTGELIAASVLDRFVVRPRPAERLHDQVSRAAPADSGVILEVRDVSVVYSEGQAGGQLQATGFQSQLTIKQIVRLYVGLYGLRLSDPEITAGLQEIGLEAEASKPFKQLSVGSSSASRCTSRWSTSLRCCCWTSRRLVSILSPVASCGVGSRTSDSRAGAFS